MKRKKTFTQRVLTKSFRRSALAFCKRHEIVFDASPANSTLINAVFECFERARPERNGDAMETAIRLITGGEPSKTDIAVPRPRRAKMRKVLSPDFYMSREWQRVRYTALVANDGRCECCGASKATGAILHVDHIKPRSRFPHLALDPSNLQVLCADCNLGKGAHDQTDWRPDADVIRIVRPDLYPIEQATAA